MNLFAHFRHLGAHPCHHRSDFHQRVSTPGRFHLLHHPDLHPMFPFGPQWDRPPGYPGVTSRPPPGKLPLATHWGSWMKPLHFWTFSSPLPATCATLLRASSYPSLRPSGGSRMNLRQNTKRPFKSITFDFSVPKQEHGVGTSWSCPIRVRVTL